MRVLRRPSSPVRRALFRVVTSHSFEIFILTTVVLNVAVMAADFWGIEHYTATYAAYNRLLAAVTNIFYAEAVAKLVALGLDYFRDSWWSAL